jgi:hypothetical protein
MKERILWIVPSRNRPEKLERFIKSFLDCTSGKADLLIGLDDDDHSCNHLIKQYPQLIWEVNAPVKGSFLKVLNAMALKYAEQYRWLGFNEDDALFKTKGYEDRFIAKLQELGHDGIVYANDLIGGKKKGLIYFPVMDSSIVKRLKFFVPETLSCMYADNFWRAMADYLGTCYYFEDMVIHHLHYRKIEGETFDDTSRIVETFQKPDRRAYEAYYDSQFLTDMKLLK